MRITYRDEWTETFITASRVVFDGGSMARICRMEAPRPAGLPGSWVLHVPVERPIAWIDASRIAEIRAL